MTCPSRILFLAAATLAVSSCGSGGPRDPALPPAAAPTPPAAPRIEVDESGGTPARGPGDLYNACERIWCVTHGRNFALDHFVPGHVGWIVHDEGHGDVFVPRDRESGPAFPQARPNVLRLCGKHLHPYFLGAGGGPVKKGGYSVALGYDRGHYASYGARVPECCLNAQGWGFLHAAVPREFRFGDRTSATEMEGSGWQKAFPARAPDR